MCKYRNGNIRNESYMEQM